MTSAVLSRLDDMFADLREKLHEEHIRKVHTFKRHESGCLASSTSLGGGRRHSLPGHGGSVVKDGQVRRVSLPVVPAKVVTADVDVAATARRISASASGQRRKFSQDSIDFQSVDGERHSDDSVILEEDETLVDDDDHEVLSKLIPIINCCDI